MSKLYRGASMDAIQVHYDTGNEFYRLWLDDTLTYSCALWEDFDEPLAVAQQRKLEHHIREAHAETAPRVLDIGCGWGSMLSHLANAAPREKLVGLTLSEAQHNYVSSLGIEKSNIRLEAWEDHQPEEPYDAIISIGAFEHFIRPEMSDEERVAVYKNFFARCSEMLKPGGYLSLQTMAYGRGSFLKNGPLFAIFPESDLPKMAQLSKGFEPSFELRRMRNDPDHYRYTAKAWIKNLVENQAELEDLIGAERYQEYVDYLTAGMRGYRARIFHLYRLTLKRLPPVRGGLSG